MAEKRFWYDFEDCNGAKMVDFKKDKEYPLEKIGDFRDIEELLNSLNDGNEQLKKDNTVLMQLLENQSIIIQELHIKLMDYQLEEDPVIRLTPHDLEVMGKAISYYTHGDV